MSVISQQTEPTHDRPCWVLTSKGAKYGNVKLVLREYVWRGETWRPAGSPDEYPRSVRAACEKADWIGRLPHQGRKRNSFTLANLNRVRELREQGMNRAQIERETELSHGIVHKLWYYQS